MAKPLISVIIPVYNAALYLQECIESVIAQTWPNLEIIIIDDGSTDESLSVAQQYQHKQINVITQPNGGACKARNRGLKEAKGEYIQFLDADDILSADKIEMQMNDLLNLPGCVGISNTVHFFTGEELNGKKPMQEWYNQAEVMESVDFLLKLYGGDLMGPRYGGMIQPNAWLTPRNVIDEAGFWNEDLTVDDDGEFFCRILLHSKGVKYAANGINFYRKFKTETSLSSHKNERSFISRMLSTDLKYSHLKDLVPNQLLDNIFARQYWDIGINAYPQHIKLSKQAINKAKKLKYSGPKYKSGKLATTLSKIVGWKLVKRVSGFIHSNKKTI
ncbi:glycosyltransferase family A protein [Mucilaginibacter auburnensis]|uniref:Glycosyl transferase family 2 n=1 Tax=Mucilaginibacter auburnensis TaxID=1457233 RepID=A0A2H9VMA3_9SPHI|nr:glycosyltransferase family A protein [Mucilaginibacter auburnensis]PJJ79452.1 glycosyl transferase family 2 [Mucilaginibacter auburnensis]